MVCISFTKFPTPNLRRFPIGPAGSESACNAGDLNSTLGREDPLEKGTPSSMLAWRIPWTVESMGRIASDRTFSFAFTLHPQDLTALTSLLCLGTQLCWTLCNPLGCSPPGSSVHVRSPGKNTEWVAIPFSRGSSQPRD